LGYDVELIQIPAEPGLNFPVEAVQAKALLKKASPFASAAAVREALLKIAGCKAGPGEAVDFIGRGLSYARFTIKPDRIHVENNCSAKELLKVHEELAQTWPDLRILDVQSKQLHSPQSFAAWWAKPL
jgi:hypothetical protein